MEGAPVGWRNKEVMAGSFHPVVEMAEAVLFEGKGFVQELGVLQIYGQKHQETLEAG